MPKSGRTVLFGLYCPAFSLAHYAEEKSVRTAGMSGAGSGPGKEGRLD